MLSVLFFLSKGSEAGFLLGPWSPSQNAIGLENLFR